MEEHRQSPVEELIAGCQNLMLHPQREEARQALAVLVASPALSFHQGDPFLVRCLLQEARAHADELAFRLEGSEYPSLYLSAAAARLCRTLTLLEQARQADGRAFRSSRTLAPSLPSIAHDSPTRMQGAAVGAPREFLRK